MFNSLINFFNLSYEVLITNIEIAQYLINIWFFIINLLNYNNSFCLDLVWSYDHPTSYFSDLNTVRGLFLGPKVILDTDSFYFRLSHYIANYDILTLTP